MDGSATIAGVVATATEVFFLWKLWTGWLVINLRVELKTARMSRRDKSDLLAVTVILDKGATDTLRVTSVALRAVPVLNGSGGAGPVVSEWTGLAPQLYHTRGAHGPQWDKTKGYSER